MIFMIKHSKRWSFFHKANYMDYLDVINKTDNWDIILYLLNIYKEIINTIVKKHDDFEKILSLYSEHPLKNRISNYIYTLVSSEANKAKNEVAYSFNED